MERFLHSRLFGPVIIVITVLLANGIYLSGATLHNPIYQQSGLTARAQPGFIRGLNTIDPNDGFSTQSLGHASVRQIVHGHMPWWNYDEQVGAPLAGGMQAASFFPLTLFTGLSGGVLYLHVALEIVASIATYYLLKRLRCRGLVAITGGIVFALNGTFAWIGNAAFNPIAFLPLLLLGIEVAYDHTVRARKRGWFLIALALALSLYAGFPETAFLDGLLATLWVVARAIQLRRHKWQQFVGKASLGGVVGLLLSAPIIVAFLDYYKVAYIGVHAGASAHAVLPAIGLPALFFPYMYGPIFGFLGFDTSNTIAAWWGNVGGYLTLSLLFLACLGVVSKGNRVLKIMLGAWIILMVARVYNLPGIVHLLSMLPGFGQLAVQRYVQASFEMAMVVLAAFGLQAMLYDHVFKRRNVLLIAGGVLTIVAVVMLRLGHEGYRLLAGAPHHKYWLMASVAWGIMIFCIVVVSGIYAYRYRAYVCMAAVGIDVLVMFALPQLSAPREAVLDTQPVNFLQAHLGQQRFFSLGPLAANYGSYYGLSSINTNNLPLPKNWTGFIASLDPAADPVVFTGTHQVNSTSPNPKDAFIANMGAYGYVGVKYLVAPPKLISVDEAQASGLQLVSKSSVAYIYAVPTAKPYFDTTTDNCIFTPQSKAVVTTQCKGSAQMIRRELYMDGWQAYIDDRPLPIRQLGPLFQSVTIPTGRHTIRFEFVPPHMNVAVMLLLGGVLGATVAYLYPAFATKSRK